MSNPKKRKLNPKAVNIKQRNLVRVGDLVAVAVISSVQHIFTQGDFGLHGWAKTIGQTGAMTFAIAQGRSGQSFQVHTSSKQGAVQRVLFSSLSPGDIVHNVGTSEWFGGSWVYVGNFGGFYRFIPMSLFKKMKAFQTIMEDRIDFSDNDEMKVDAEDFTTDWHAKKSTLATPFESPIWFAK